VDRRKWTVWTSLSTLVIVGLVALSTTVVQPNRVGASKTVYLNNSIAGTECEDLGEYLFILNGLTSGADAPASITVVLSGGGTLTVPSTKVLNKNVHYSLAEGDVPAGQTPVDAYAVVYDAFKGNFVISHVPCGEPSPSPSPEPSPEPTPEPSPGL